MSNSSAFACSAILNLQCVGYADTQSTWNFHRCTTLRSALITSSQSLAVEHFTAKQGQHTESATLNAVMEEKQKKNQKQSSNGEDLAPNQRNVFE